MSHIIMSSSYPSKYFQSIVVVRQRFVHRINLLFDNHPFAHWHPDGYFKKKGFSDIIRNQISSFANIVDFEFQKS